MRAFYVPVGILALAGCTASRENVRPIDPSATRAAVHQADAAGAERYPSAALHLKLAQDQLHRAEKLLGDGRRDEADRTLQKAHADAELARLLAEEPKLRAEADALVQRAKVLEEGLR